MKRYLVWLDDNPPYVSMARNIREARELAEVACRLVCALEPICERTLNAPPQ